MKDLVERNKVLFLLMNKLVGNKQYEEIVLLGKLISNDAPSIKKSYTLCTSMIDDKDVQEISNKIHESLMKDLNEDKHEIIFRALSLDTKEYVEGNYHHNIRKGTFHSISPKETNLDVMVDRNTLQMKNIYGDWVNV